MSSQQPRPFRHSMFNHRGVLRRETLEDMGRVDVVWMYPEAHRVLGVVTKRGFLGSKRWAFTLNQIHSITEAGVLVTADPTETDVQKVKQLQTLLGLEVWTDEGLKLGKIQDYAFHPKTGAIAYYLFASDAWLSVVSGVYRLSPKKIIRRDDQRVVITAESSRTCKMDREGLQEKLTQVGDRLRENYSEVAEELHDWADQAQATTQQVRGQVLQWGQQAKQWTQTLRQQAKPWAETALSQVWQEDGPPLADQVKTKGRSLLDRLREQAGLLTDRIEELDFLHLGFDERGELRPNASAADDPQGDEWDTDGEVVDWLADPGERSPQNPPAPSSPESRPTAAPSPESSLHPWPHAGDQAGGDAGDPIRDRTGNQAVPSSPAPTIPARTAGDVMATEAAPSPKPPITPAPPTPDQPSVIPPDAVEDDDPWI